MHLSYRSYQAILNALDTCKIRQEVLSKVWVSIIKRYTLSQKLRVNARIIASYKSVKKIYEHARKKRPQSYDVQVCI